jgi:hypothetical protein
MFLRPDQLGFQPTRLLFPKPGLHFLSSSLYGKFRPKVAYLSEGIKISLQASAGKLEMLGIPQINSKKTLVGFTSGEI